MNNDEKEMSESESQPEVDKDENNDKITLPMSKRLHKLQEEFHNHRNMILKSGIPLIITNIINKTECEETGLEKFYINMHFLDELTLIKKTETLDFYNDIMRIHSLKKDVKKTTLIENITTFNKHILKNIFLSKDVKENISEIFYKSTRTNFLIQRFIRRYRMTKLKKHDMNTDLCMTPLEEFGEKFKITLVENRTIYYFRLTDVLNIVKRALSNYDDICIVAPLSVKNPYTNLEFSKANLYNIFFKTAESGLLMPILFYKYFLAEFDIERFTMENDTYLMNIAIDDYVKETSNYEIYQESLSMLEYYKRSVIRSVDLYKFIQGKTPEQVVEICREMLKLHFLTKMSNSALTRTISYRELRKLLINFENEYKERKVFRRFSSRSPTSREMSRIRARLQNRNSRSRQRSRFSPSISPPLVSTSSSENDEVQDISGANLDGPPVGADTETTPTTPTTPTPTNSFIGPVDHTDPRLTEESNATIRSIDQIINDTFNRIQENIGNVIIDGEGEGEGESDGQDDDDDDVDLDLQRLLQQQPLDSDDDEIMEMASDEEDEEDEEDDEEENTNTPPSGIENIGPPQLTLPILPPPSPQSSSSDNQS